MVLCFAGLDKVMRVVQALEGQRPVVLFNPRLARCGMRSARVGIKRQ